MELIHFETFQPCFYSLLELWSSLQLILLYLLFYYVLVLQYILLWILSLERTRDLVL